MRTVFENYWRYRVGLISPKIRYFFIGVVLWLPAKLFYSISKIRLKWSSHISNTLPVPVISVGNLSVGGTGKTPFVKYLIDFIHTKFTGIKAAVLTRGYGEDEILEHRDNNIYLGVGTDRYSIAKEMIKVRKDIGCFILDDGFQHVKLDRNLDFVLVDLMAWKPGFLVLPYGPYREDLSAVRRADIIVMTRIHDVAKDKVGLFKDELDKRGLLDDKLLLKAHTEITHFSRLTTNSELRTPNSELKNCLAFCGLGNPKAFFSSLKRAKVSVDATCEFCDHHVYSAKDARQILDLAKNKGTNLIVTTKKDIMRPAEGAINIGELLKKAGFKGQLYVANIKSVIDDEDVLFSRLSRVLCS